MKTKSGKHRLTQKSVNILYKNLKNKENEKDIENAWREFFSQYYNSGSDHILKVISPYDVDGYLEVDDGLFFLFPNSITLIICKYIVLFLFCAKIVDTLIM